MKCKIAYFVYVWDDPGRWPTIRAIASALQPPIPDAPESERAWPGVSGAPAAKVQGYTFAFFRKQHLCKSGMGFFSRFEKSVKALEKS